MTVGEPSPLRAPGDPIFGCRGTELSLTPARTRSHRESNGAWVYVAVSREGFGGFPNCEILPPTSLGATRGTLWVPQHLGMRCPNHSFSRFLTFSFFFSLLSIFSLLSSPSSLCLSLPPSPSPATTPLPRPFSPSFVPAPPPPFLYLFVAVPHFPLSLSSSLSISFHSKSRGFADVGYHGNRVGSAVITPAIDQLSADGVRLENYYVNFLCSPTRTSLMSGRYVRCGRAPPACPAPRPRPA